MPATQPCIVTPSPTLQQQVARRYTSIQKHIEHVALATLDGCWHHCATPKHDPVDVKGRPPFQACDANMANMANRRGMPSLATAPSSRVGPGTLLPELPPISALFLIDFDVKAGYTIIWKEAVPGLELEGVVEYKSLPSGLHTVSDDLIYFVHEDGYAGLSAFINAPTDEEESRHARMIAVGVLVPLSYGRLGRAWRHAQGLKDMAVKLAADRKQTQMLVEYWDKCGTRDTSGQAPAPITDSPLNSPALSFVKRPSPKADGHARNRSASEGAALLPPGHRLSPFHPAWSLNKLLDTFGPLIFPIQRAALLRKRILISTHAPVHEACNFGTCVIQVQGARTFGR